MAAARPSPWVLGARSETGYVRTANEDRMGWARAPFGDVYVVSDGMGGYRGGALAAELTSRTLQEHLVRIAPDSPQIHDDVQQAFTAANQAVRERRDPDDPDTREMGATGVVLIVAGARFMVAHVGDSRAYLWRRGSLRQLTRDHSRVQTMMDSGLLTPEQAAVHPDASVLDRAIGHKPAVQADVSDWTAIEPNDLLLLCSDGLCGYVSDQEIAAILKAGAAPQATTDRLIECALGKGGEDNVTVQLVGYALAKPSWLRQPIGILSVSLAACAFVAAVGVTAYWRYPEAFKSLWTSKQAVNVPAPPAKATSDAPLPVAAKEPGSAPAPWPPSDVASAIAAAASTISPKPPVQPPVAAVDKSKRQTAAAQTSPRPRPAPAAGTVRKAVTPPKKPDHTAVKDVASTVGEAASPPGAAASPPAPAPQNAATDGQSAHPPSDAGSGAPLPLGPNSPG